MPKEKIQYPSGNGFVNTETSVLWVRNGHVQLLVERHPWDPTQPKLGQTGVPMYPPGDLKLVDEHEDGTVPCGQTHSPETTSTGSSTPYAEHATKPTELTLDNHRLRFYGRSHDLGTQARRHHRPRPAIHRRAG